jgi:hypothetical protein
MCRGFRFCTGMALIAFLLAPGLGWSQDPNGKQSRVATAVYTDTPITVDGKLDDPAWEKADVIGSFTQKEPEEGKTLSQRTEVRILYNKQYLYFGAYCHDSQTDRILINDITHDFDFLDEDYFAIVLDTFNDDRNGYYFGTTPIGGQRDVQFSEEGRIQNVNWDGVWYAEARRLDDGYVVEIAIPFNTLRFSRENVQTWGVNLIRRLRGRNEYGTWAPLTRRHTGISGIALAGELRGIENVEPGRNLQVKPYALAGAKKLGSRLEGAKQELEGGIDMKYGLTSGLTLDLTGNTDFSHVEADTQQLNLTRFPLFFEEKREFFLENSGIFQFGSLQNSEALLFHSRTIGLAGGQPIPILGGARLSGRSGPWSLGLLNMQTRSDEAVPANNFTVTRVRRNLLNNSNMGAMFLNRESRLANDHNRAVGADSNFLFFRTNLRFSGALAKTYTPYRVGDDSLGKVEGEFQSNLLHLLSNYVDIGNNFNPEMGFVSRRGRRMVKNVFELKPRLRPSTYAGKYVRDLNFSVTSQHVFLSSGRTETKYLLNQYRIGFQDGGTLGTQYERNFERLLLPFRVNDRVTIPSGDYAFNRSKVWYNSNQSKLLSGNVEWQWADFYNGERTELVLKAQVRPGYRFSTSIDYSHNDIDLPQGAFTTNLIGFRTNYTFNAKMFLNSFIQYNSDAKQLSSNIRFRLTHRPLSDMYVVYNDVRDRKLDRSDRRLTLKYTHLLSF